MTAHSDRYPQPPDHRPTQIDNPAATRDDSPRVVGHVPITVWRLDDRDDDQPATQPGAGFASRLARRLVLIYTRHGDTVVDFDHDTNLHSAATATGRSYLAITEPARLAELDQISQPVSLVTLQWPRTAQPLVADRVADLFTACRLMMSGEACVIAAVRTGDPADLGATFADHERALRSAAGSAGFAHVLQIVAVSASGEGDQFLYYATEAEATHAANQAAPTTGRHVLHIDLMIFTTGRRDSSGRDRDLKQGRTGGRSSAGDLPEVAEGRSGGASTSPPESSYPPAAVGRLEPLPQRTELVRAKESPGRTSDSCSRHPGPAAGTPPSDATDRRRRTGRATRRKPADSTNPAGES